MKRRHVTIRGLAAIVVACGAVAMYAGMASAEPAIRVAGLEFPATPRAVYSPTDLVRGPDGSMWVADTGNDRVVKLAANGERLATWTTDSAGVPFKRPTAVAFGPSGDAYVVDSLNHRVVRIGASGSVEGTFGEFGTGSGQLNFPFGVACDSTGDVFVSDMSNDRIVRFSASGQFETAFGSAGSLPGQFKAPKGLSISGTQLFIADSGNKRVSVITTDGGWVTSWGPYASGEFTVSRYNSPSDVAVVAGTVYVADTGNYQIEACTTDGAQIARWGSVGSEPTQFRFHTGLWADGTAVWVADTGNNRILQHTTSGGFLQSWQAAGAGVEELDSPRAVALDASGASLVADTANSRVQKYSPNGTHLGSLGVGDLNQPQGVAVGPDGSIYVADTGNNRVRKYSAEGAVEATFGAGDLNAPRGVTVDVSGNVYVADTGGHAVRIYRPDGTVLHQWGGSGTAGMQFNTPSDIAVTGSRVYVSDTGNHRVSQFDVGTSVVYIGSWGGLGTTAGALRLPLGITIASDGNVWVCDSANDRIQEFTASGQYVSAFGLTGGEAGEFHAPSGIDAGSGGSMAIVEVQGSRVQRVSLDTAAPVTTVSGVSEDWASEVTVTLTAADDVGVASTRYSIGSLPAQKYVAPFGQLPEGQTTLYYASTDLVGRQETTKSVAVRVDRTPPATGSNLDGGWYRSPFSVVLSRTDALSGATLTTYSVDAGTPKVYSGSFTVSGEGDHTVKFRSVDAAGNSEVERSKTLRLDDTPPVTSSDADAQWRSTPQPVTLQSSDARSGVASITYRIGAASAKAYAGPFLVDAEGETTVGFNAVDVAGNVERVRTAVVRIDRTAPVSVMNATEPFADFTRRVTISSTDGGSGSFATYYSINGQIPGVYSVPFTIDSRVPTTIDYWSVDQLGNRETTRTALVEWDYVPPVTTTSQLGGEWRTTPLLVSLTATDAMSAVKSTWYRLNDGVSTPYTGAFTVSAEGQTRVTYWSVDAKDNVETGNVGWVRIDRTPPSTNMSVADPLPDDTRLVSLTASDTGAGGISTYYRVDGGAAQRYEAPFPVSSLVPVTVSYWSVDRMGNSETTETTLIDDDFDPPVTTSSMTGTWTAEANAVTFEATDTMSGVFATYYRIGASEPVTYTGVPVPVSAEGETRIAYWSVDHSGLREPDNVGWVRIDRAPPVSTIAAGTPYANRTRIITLSAEDDGVGGITTYYRLGSGETTTYAAPFLIDASVPTTIAFCSEDGLGHREPTQTVRVEYDYQPPVTTSNIDGDWRKIPMTVELSATDADSGVRATYYRLGEGLVMTYTAAPFTVNTEGVTRVVYWSVDNRSNVESDNVAWIGIDRTAPESTATVMYDPWRSSAIVTLRAEDVGGCGLGGIQYRLGSSPNWIDYLGGFYLGTAGDNVIHFRSVDLLDNTEGEQSITVSLRELVTDTASTIDGEWHKDTVTVRLSSSYEGTAPVTTYYRIGTGGTVQYVNAFQIATEGETPVSYWSTAKGVVEPAKTGIVRIDRTPPVTSYSQAIGTNPTRVTVTLAANDVGGSGVGIIQYRTRSSVTWLTYTGPFDVDRAAVVWYRSVDNVGNEESAQSRTIPPATRTNRSNTAWYRTSVAVSLIATHPAGAPSVSYRRQVGQSIPVRYSGPFTVSTDGVNVIYYWSVADGVVETSSALTLHVDRTKPVITTVSSPTHPRSTVVYRSRYVRFSWRGYDKTSRIRGYAFKIDRSKYTVPSSATRVTSATSVYRRLSSGTWYVHVRAVDKAGNWGTTKHFRVRIR